MKTGLLMVKSAGTEPPSVTCLYACEGIESNPSAHLLLWSRVHQIHFCRFPTNVVRSKELWTQHSQSPVLPLFGAVRRVEEWERKLSLERQEEAGLDLSSRSRSFDSKANQVTATPFDHISRNNGKPITIKKQTTSELPAAGLGRSRHTSGSEGSLFGKRMKQTITFVRTRGQSCSQR